MVGERQTWLTTRVLGLAAVLVAMMLASDGRAAPVSAQTAPPGWGDIKICTDASFREPAQVRSERKRHYRRPGQAPLALAGVPPGEVSYLDALAI